MIDSVLFDKISIYMELIKNNSDHIFGGLQIICIGDLAQLQPVNGNFFIKSAAYQNGNFRVFELTKCFRQTDPKFQQILSEARFGNLSDESYKILLQQNSIDEEKFKGIRPMILCPTNREVDSINQMELFSLVDKDNISTHTYKIKSISSNTKKIDLISKAQGIQDIELAVGAQVMCTMNISAITGERLVNGSQGKVVEIFPNHIILDMIDIQDPISLGYTKVLDPDCDEFVKPIYLFEYMPLRLCYAVSIHKAQGLSANVLQTSLSRVFTHGQAYTAISRVRTLDGLMITGITRKSFICSPEIIEFYNSI
jgi:ATP-dependent DNA helicase PIF1